MQEGSMSDSDSWEYDSADPSMDADECPGDFHQNSFEEDEPSQASTGSSDLLRSGNVREPVVSGFGRCWPSLRS